MLAATKTENTHLARLLGTRTRHHSFGYKQNARDIYLILSAAFILTKDTDRSKLKVRGLSQCYGSGFNWVSGSGLGIKIQAGQNCPS
jgi:hypothetical protein